LDPELFHQACPGHIGYSLQLGQMAGARIGTGRSRFVKRPGSCKLRSELFNFHSEIVDDRRGCFLLSFQQGLARFRRVGNSKFTMQSSYSGFQFSDSLIVDDRCGRFLLSFQQGLARFRRVVNSKFTMQASYIGFQLNDSPITGPRVIDCSLFTLHPLLD